VVYGQAVLGGIVTDAVLTNSNQTMWYCITICEKTGNLINGTASVINFEQLYWNQTKVNFQADGITVASVTDDNDVVVTDFNGLIKIYPFSGSSLSPVKFAGQALGNTQPAYSLFPNWTANYTMNDLVFCLVRIDYNRDKNVTGLGKLEFKIKNTMTDPGDCLYDYMSNTRYGAGIPDAEINKE
jgi:hypothetical protein